MLGIVVTDALFHAHPDLPEGRLAKLRASVVNMRALASVAHSMQPESLGAYLLLGRGEEATGGREKASILADSLEALFGAVYVDQGLEVASRLIHQLFDGLLDEAARAGAGLDWKTSLQELTAQLGLGVPDYVMTSAGPDHEKIFTASAQVAGELFAASSGRSKKEAEQQAAETAWRSITRRAAVAAAATEGGQPNGQADRPAAG